MSTVAINSVASYLVMNETVNVRQQVAKKAGEE